MHGWWRTCIHNDLTPSSQTVESRSKEDPVILKSLGTGKGAAPEEREHDAEVVLKMDMTPALLTPSTGPWSADGGCPC